jgi:putative ABC transport system substrate-binding protein
MRRREFITLLGGAATAWPLPARAQQRAMPVIGLLSGRAPETDAPLLAPFRQGLREIGYVVDQNVSLEYRWASGEYDRLSALATELVDRNVTVIVAIGGVLSAIAARSRTATIPIVFVAGDPVKRGLVTSLSRPGGNITGVSTLLGDVVSKQLGLTYELLPTARKIAVVVNPTNPEADDVRVRFRGQLLPWANKWKS